jgi:pterin-4a-carbinolamine dehydratase
VTLTNVEKLAQATKAEPSVAINEGAVTVTVRTHGAVYVASADSSATAARRLLDELGIE